MKMKAKPVAVHRRAETKSWLLIGYSVRAMAQSAFCFDYELCCLDVFGDRETLIAAKGRYMPLVLKNWQIDITILPTLVARMQALHAPNGFAGIVYTGGFEAQYLEIATLNLASPVFNCPAARVQNIRLPQRWFAMLDHLRLAYPPVVFSPPQQSRGWIMKSAYGSAGLHIRLADTKVETKETQARKPIVKNARTRQSANHAVMKASQPTWSISEDQYWQRRVKGIPASALFVVRGGAVQVLGWQWLLLSPTLTLPYRFGGILAAPEMPLRVRSQVKAALKKIITYTQTLPLQGLCGLDFLIPEDSDKPVLLLEINVRPTASIALYPECNFLKMQIHGVHYSTHVSARAHIQKARKKASVRVQHLRAYSFSAPYRGEAVLWALRDIRIAADFPWPPYCRDVPNSVGGSHMFRAGEPIATVSACVDFMDWQKISASTSVQQNIKRKLCNRLKLRLRLLSDALQRTQLPQITVAAQNAYAGRYTNAFV